MTAMLTTDRLEAIVDRQDDDLNRLRDAISLGMDAQQRGDARTLAYAKLDVLDDEAFLAAANREGQRCHRITDMLALIEIEFDEALDEVSEIRLLTQLRNIAEKPGELVGRIDDNRYAVAIPWMTVKETESVAETLAKSALSLLPKLDHTIMFTCGIPDANGKVAAARKSAMAAPTKTFATGRSR